MGSGVKMQKAAVIDSDATVKEGRNLEGEFEHLLQREARNGDVGCHPEGVFTAGDASDFLVVCSTAVAVVDHDFLARQLAQLFERINEAVLDSQFAAAMAGKLGLGEMRAQIAHVCAFLNRSCIQGSSG